jgi:hypothetical protein
MKLLLKLFMLGLLCVLAACSDTDTSIEESATEVITPSTNKTASPHTIQSMKNTLEDARGVEDMLQEHADAQQREIDNIR